jgi:hypothetical protein
MTTRRRFMALLGGLGGLLGFLWSTKVPARVFARPVPPGPPETYSRVFRCNDYGEWREIAWEDMRPGDKVLILDLDEHPAGIGTAWLRSLEALEPAGAPHGPDGAVLVKSKNDLLPVIWGCPEELLERKTVNQVGEARGYKPLPGTAGDVPAC